MAQQKIVWSAKALASLTEILLFYKKQNGNTHYSKKLYHQIKQSVLILTDFPKAGKLTDMSQIRELVLNRNSLFYQVTETQINIVLVWDNRRNPQELFEALQT